MYFQTPTFCIFHPTANTIDQVASVIIFLLFLKENSVILDDVQVYEWMRKKGIYEFSSSDYAAQFNLICKVRGCSAAEHYVKNLPKQARNDKTYGKLLHCYMQEHRGDIERSPLWHIQKMKELGFALSPHVFNEIMHICARGFQTKALLEVFAEMKKSKVSPDNDSYRMCIRSLGRHDLHGMERALREMETQPHIVMDWFTYAVVAEFYERVFLVDKATDALEKARVILQKKDIKRRPNYLLEIDYVNVIMSLVKLGELGEAMKFLNEWEASGYWCRLYDLRIPYLVIEEYVKRGKLQEAFDEIVVWYSRGKDGAEKLKDLLCKEYLKAGNVFQAFNCFRGTRHAFQVHPFLPMLFFKYIEENCGSFFPLRCTGTMLSEVNTIHSVQHENSIQSVNIGCENIIKSLVELGKLKEAVKMVIEWHSSDYVNIVKLIMEGYCKKCFFVEAEAMAEAWTREKRSQVAEIWFVLATHYQLHGKLVRGFECMRKCFNITPGLKGNYGMMFWTFTNGIEHSRCMNARGRI
ncbi:hypothetical protein DM860_001358 [Cuscuta australis]|uniref:Pentacotripeptide-repeat region of PRORP domain-containing protein n=1 Tax=Cuscuta australis TaxID=267555 RepID=A0A328DX47_9ASTE|nr:hypothetical protein DM860_001358 [Cuscuta australis]